MVLKGISPRFIRPNDKQKEITGRKLKACHFERARQGEIP